MNKELIIVREYCQSVQIDTDFIELLAHEGLININIVDHEQYLYVSELKDIEKYIRWYYDLSINIEGIDAIRHLLKRIEDMQNEIISLRNHIKQHGSY